MLFVPLPFVVALLLVILFAAVLRTQNTSESNRPFLALIALCALQSIILGLRWGYDVEVLRYVLPVLAACIPPLVYASFRGLTLSGSSGLRFTYLIHVAPPLCMLELLLFAPMLIDAALIVIFVGYALAVLNLGRAGPDALDEARFDGAVPAYRALVVAAAALCLSALFDLVVFLDFEWTKGGHVEALVGFANLIGLVLLGLTAMIAGRSIAAPEATAGEAPIIVTSSYDRDVLSRIETLMRDQKLFRDENLNLSRLARRAGIPGRHISGAVNRLTRKNVSQYVNEFRIAETCRLLKDTDMSVTAAMFESGFQTKSNFNREFRRLINLSPASWREQNRPVQKAGV